MASAFAPSLHPLYPNRLRQLSRSPHPLHSCRKFVPTTMVLQPPPSINLPNSPTDPLTTTLHRIRASPIVLCIRMTDPTQALLAAQAALHGGLRTIEVTLTTPSAPQIIRHLVTDFPDACIGAGTVLTASDVTRAFEAGAKFALSPVTDIAIIQQAHQLGMLSIPGAATPTEIYNAYHHAGARLVKVFPVNLCGGVEFVKAMQGPLGHIPLLPTSGVDLETLPKYFAARNVWAVGASRQILLKDALGHGDWNTITERASVWAAIAAEHTSRVSR